MDYFYALVDEVEEQFLQHAAAPIQLTDRT
jgi:hypothetical protein